MARRKGGAAAAGDKGDELVVHALRLVENTDRFSSDMRALEKGEQAGGVSIYCGGDWDSLRRNFSSLLPKINPITGPSFFYPVS